MDLDDLLEDYERLWADRVPGLDDLRSTLDSFTDLSKDSLVALNELIKVDIHHRWCAAGDSTMAMDCEPYLVEDYGECFPAIRKSSGYPDEFIWEELVARQQVGKLVSAETVASRFPNLTVAGAEALLTRAANHVKVDGDRTQEATPDIRAVVANRIEIRHLLGQGSMGRVYLAFDPRLQRQVAIKIPLFSFDDDPIQRQRFVREGRAAASLAHPNIVSVYETGQLVDYFIASEYVAGPTLKQWYEDRDCLAPDTAGQLLLLVARGVAMAHAEGIVHRDLKPSNVLLSPVNPVGSTGSPNTGVELDGKMFCPKVTDFGLAGYADATSGLTMTGAMLGTAAYMSPEQASGAPAGYQADVFSLGVILYELLAGESPFARDTYAGTIDRIRNYDPPPVRSVKPKVAKDLSAICYRALDKDPSRRFSTATEFADDLQRFLNRDRVHARTPGSMERISRWTKRNPAIAILSTLVCLALLWSLLQNRRLGETLATSERLRAAANAARTDLGKANGRLGQANEALKTVNDDLAKTNARYEQEVFVQDMILAFNAWETRNSAAVATLLDKHLPQAGQVDHRGIEWYVLSRLIQADAPRAFVGHSGMIDCVRTAPDRKTFVSVARDKTLIHWDLASGEQLWKQEFQFESPRSIAFRRDGSSFFAGANFVREIRTRDGKILNPGVTYHQDPVEALAINPAQDLLVSMEVQEQFRFNALADMSYSLTDAGTPSWRSRRIGFSPDGKFLFFCRNRDVGPLKEFVMWDVDEHKPAAVLTGRKQTYLASVAVSPDGRFVAVATGGDIHFFDVDQRKWIAQSANLTGMTLDLEFSPDQRHLACAVKGGTLTVIDVSEIDELSGELPFVHSKQASESNLNTVTWIDNERFMTAGDQGVVHLHKLPQPMKVYDSYPNQRSHFLLNGELMLVGSDSGDPQLIDCESQETLGEIRGFGKRTVDRAAVDPDRQWLGITSGNQAWVWDIGRGEMIGSFVPDLLTRQTKIGTWSIRGIAISRDGQIATTANGGSDFSLQIRDVRTLERTAAISLPHGSGWLRFSPSGKRLIVEYGERCHVLSLSDMKPIELPRTGGVHTWLSDTEMLHREGERYHIVDVETLEVTQTLENGDESHAATFLGFTEDRQRLITARLEDYSESDGIRFWHLPTGRHLGNLDIVASDIAITPDGKGLRLLMLNKATNRLEYRELHPGDD